MQRSLCFVAALVLICGAFMTSLLLNAKPFSNLIASLAMLFIACGLSVLGWRAAVRARAHGVPHIVLAVLALLLGSLLLFLLPDAYQRQGSMQRAIESARQLSLEPLMNTDRFWQIVDSARSSAGNDVEARIEALREQLEPLSTQQLQAFQDEYDARIRESYRWDLWGAAYLMNGGCSDDGFRYFRDWLISEGRSVFESALASPDSLANQPRSDQAELELFGYVALEIYEQKGGGELERDMSTEMAMPAGQEWTEDQLAALFPKLAAKYSQ